MRKRLLQGSAVIATVALLLLLWMWWEASAPPHPDEMRARLAASGWEPVVINGWRVTGMRSPERVEAIADGSPLLYESYTFVPVSPMAKLRSLLQPLDGQ